MLDPYQRGHLVSLMAHLVVDSNIDNMESVEKDGEKLFTSEEIATFGTDEETIKQIINQLIPEIQEKVVAAQKMLAGLVPRG